MKEYYKDALNHSKINIFIILFIYILGLGVILFSKKRMHEIVKSKIKDYEQHIFSLVNIIEKRDRYTAGHSKRVASYGILIAEYMGLDTNDIDDLYRASILHDIGKISTPDAILLKPGSLSNLEYQIIKEHVTISYELLKSVDIYKDIAEIIRHHHEHYDGSGYPNGLKKDEIPLLAQIMIVTDAFDAMTTNRIYKARKNIEDALAELNKLSSKQFHPKIVNAATQALKDVIIEEQITQQATSKSEEARFSYFYKDQITHVYNREYLEFILLNNDIKRFQMSNINIIYLHNFSQYNKKYSWDSGDKLLKKFAQYLIKVSKSEFVFRIYGDDFAILNREEYDISQDKQKLEDIFKDTGISIRFQYLNIKEDNINSIKELEQLILG